MSVHLSVDLCTAVLLAAAPFLFGYSSLGLNVRLPQVVAGMAVILRVLVAQTNPQVTYSKRSERVRLPRHSKCSALAQAEQLTVLLRSALKAKTER